MPTLATELCRERPIGSVVITFSSTGRAPSRTHTRPMPQPHRTSGRCGPWSTSGPPLQFPCISIFRARGLEVSVASSAWLLSMWASSPFCGFVAGKRVIKVLRQRQTLDSYFFLRRGCRHCRCCSARRFASWTAAIRMVWVHLS